MLANVNWPAVLLGTVAAYALGMLWFGKLFGTAWARGSHGIQPPKSPPVPAMLVQLIGTFLMAWLIGATETQQAIWTALVAILAIASLQLGGGLFSQKSATAALIDGGYVVAAGGLMILAQGIL